MLNEAPKRDRDRAEARNNRGVVYMEGGKYDLAAADFNAVLDSLSPTEKVNARYNLGLLANKRERWADAEREFSKILGDDPQFRKAYRERGLVRVKTED